MVYSPKNSINKDDLIRFGRNLLIFFAPLLLVLLEAYQKGESVDLKNVVIAFFISALADLIKRYSREQLTIQEDNSDDAFGDELDEDILLLEWESELLRKLSKVRTQDNIIHSYNQYLQKETTSACTLYSPISAISSLYNKLFTKDDIMSMWNYAVKNYWYKQWVGNYAETGVKAVCKRWNESNPSQKVVYFKTYHWSEEAKIALEKWYALCSSIGGNSKYNEDRYDGVLNLKDHWKQTYWHAIPVYKVDGKYTVADSLAMIPRYTLEHSPQEIKAFRPNCYVILPEREVGAKILKAIEKIRAKRLAEKL